MKKIIIYSLVIVIAVTIIGGLYYWLTCPPKEKTAEKPLPTLEEMKQKASEAIEKGESYLAPYDPEMVVEDEGIKLVVNRIKIMLEEGEDKGTAEEIALKINGTIVGFVEFNVYQIELKTFTVSDLENALNIVESDSRVIAAIKTTFLKAY